jgi:hypothetical protein
MTKRSSLNHSKTGQISCVSNRYRVSTSDGGGYCDCGDSEAFLQDSMCEKHLKLSLNKPPKEDILKDFPEGLADRTKMILMQVCLLDDR